MVVSVGCTPTHSPLPKELGDFRHDLKYCHSNFHAWMSDGSLLGSVIAFLICSNINDSTFLLTEVIMIPEI